MKKYLWQIQFMDANQTQTQNFVAIASTFENAEAAFRTVNPVSAGWVLIQIQRGTSIDAESAS